MASGMIRRWRQSRRDIEQFLLGQTHQRTTHQGAERQSIAGIGEHSRERDEVLHLLAAEKTFPGLGGDRKPARFERTLIAPELRAGRRQECDATRRERHEFAVVVADRHVPDQARAEIGDGLGLSIANLRRPRVRAAYRS